MHYIFSYILTGFIVAAINDIVVLPKYLENHPDDKFLGLVKWRIVLSTIIIIGWLPLFIWMLYQALMYDGSDQQ